MSLFYDNSKNLKEILNECQMDNFQIEIVLIGGYNIMVLERSIIESFDDCLVIKQQKNGNGYIEINNNLVEKTRDIIIPYSAILYITERET